MDFISGSIGSVKSGVNNLFLGKEPWQVSAITATSVLISYWIWDVVLAPEEFVNGLRTSFYQFVKQLPFVRKRIEAEQEKVTEILRRDVVQACEGVPYIVSIPENGRSPAEIKNLVDAYIGLGHYEWTKGRVSGTVYYFDQELTDVLTEVFRSTCYTNPLHPDVFPGVCKMEAEIVKMVLKMFHGGADSCGTMTSGGTESILMACKAYRDFAKEVRNVRYPEMILPISAHSAFDKAAAFFGIKTRHVQLDQDTMCVNLNEMERCINRNTIMLVGSTPNFPYGTMDNVEKIAQLGLKYGIPVHVDCCLGSFILPFMQSVGYAVSPFDFSVPGVTSISVDTHKYGFAPKGSSLILYSETKYLHHQYYVSLSWPGGHYGSTAVSGSRSGAIIASCWATLMYFGKSGYREETRKILKVSRYIEEGLRNIDGIFVFGKPLSTVIAIGSNKFHIYRLCKLLNEKQWNLNMLQFPFGIHICVTQLHTTEGVADAFLTDVKSSVEYCLQNPNEKLSGTAAIYGSSAALPIRSVVGDFTKIYLDAHYYVPPSSNADENI